jgi:hypothetical protein
MVSSSFQTFSAAAWLYPFQKSRRPPFCEGSVWGELEGRSPNPGFRNPAFEGTVTAVIPVKTGIQGPKKWIPAFDPAPSGTPADGFRRNDEA